MYVSYTVQKAYSLILFGTSVVLSERIVEKVKMCEVRSEIYGASDHVPVVMEIDSELVTGN